MKIIVKTGSSIEYLIDAARFEIHNGILYFYDEHYEVIWVIKEWNSFFQESEKGFRNNLSPDEYYENIEEK